MSRLFAEFTSAEAIVTGAQRAKDEGFATLDALTPYPVPGVDALVPASRPTIRVPMALAGFGTAAFAFGFQWWSAVVAYPFNSGGRPLFSWPVFLLVPFEVGVFAAALAGLIAFFVHCGLPRLHHPAFGVGGVERASQDRYFLIFDHPSGDALTNLQDLLCEAGAVSISEAEA